jgi:hypothetical protein
MDRFALVPLPGRDDHFGEFTKTTEHTMSNLIELHDRSDRFRLNAGDVVRSLIVTCLTVFLASVIETLQAGKLPDAMAMKKAAIASLAAGLAYLLKNLSTNSKGVMFQPG